MRGSRIPRTIPLSHDTRFPLESLKSLRCQEKEGEFTGEVVCGGSMVGNVHVHGLKTADLQLNLPAALKPIRRAGRNAFMLQKDTRMPGYEIFLLPGN